VKPYSIDLRERILADCDGGLTTSQVAAKFRVSPSWVRRLKQRRRETGQVAPAEYRHGPGPSWGSYAQPLREAVAAQPDATLGELKARLALAVAISTLWRAVAALGLSVKKKSSGPPSRTARM
jgi:transposase